MVFARLARIREGRAMAKDMSKVYSEMLTKELVALRKKHHMEILALMGSVKRKDVARREICGDLCAQINRELADRVSEFNLFV